MKKTRKRTYFKENIGKVLIDLGKLVFGSMFLGGVLRGEIPPLVMVTGGFLVSALFCFIGLFWTSGEKANGEARASQF